jgi:hypothetical protein
MLLLVSVSFFVIFSQKQGFASSVEEKSFVVEEMTVIGQTHARWQ